MRHRAGFLTVLLASLLLASSASADTISTADVSFNLSSSSSQPPVPGQSEILNFTQFNPALGTLTSVAVVGTSALDLSASNVGSCGTASMTVTPQVGSVALPALTDTGNFGTGTFCGQQTFTANFTPSFNVTAPGLLSAYIGSGTAPVTFSYSVTTSGEQGEDSVSWSGSGHLVYTYTPVSTVPEPSSLMLLGSGVLGLVGVIRRKLRA